MNDEGESGEESRGGRQDGEMRRVQELFGGFLHAVRILIEPKLEEERLGTPLALTTIGRVFSVPTTWSPEVVFSYQGIIERACYTSVLGHKAIMHRRRRMLLLILQFTIREKERKRQPNSEYVLLSVHFLKYFWSLIRWDKAGECFAFLRCRRGGNSKKTSAAS